jgi:hypothetical protein
LAAVNNTAPHACALFTHIAVSAIRINNRHIGDCLRKWHVNKFPHAADLTVHFIRYAYRTGLYTGATTCTLFLIDISCLLHKRYIEAAFYFFDFFDLSICKYLYIGMIIHFIHLGGLYAYGTIICREGFIQSCHHTPDTCRVINQIDLCSILGSIQRRIDSGNATTDYQY